MANRDGVEVMGGSAVRSQEGIRLKARKTARNLILRGKRSRWFVLVISIFNKIYARVGKWNFLNNDAK